MKSYWPDKSRAWSTAWIPITAAISCGRQNRRPIAAPPARQAQVREPQVRESRARCVGRRRRGRMGAAADHRNLYVALSGLLAQPANASGSLTALDIDDRRRRAGTRPRRSRPAPRVSAIARMRRRRRSPSCRAAHSPDRWTGTCAPTRPSTARYLWDFDTAKDFQTKNGVKASGGPLDHGGATIVNGTRLRQFGQHPARFFGRRKIGLEGTHEII